MSVPRTILLATTLLVGGCGTAPDDPADAATDAATDASPDAVTDAGTDAAPTCSDVPECDLACLEGTHNPTDVDGCVHSCRCVDDGLECDAAACGDPAGCEATTCDDASVAGCTGFCLRASAGADCTWETTACPTDRQRWMTCGDPVCMGHTDRGYPACTSERVGEGCDVEGETCDPGDDCNALILCSDTDPISEFGCPISRRAFKQDIRYLSPTERSALAAELLRVPLATWRYIAAPERERVGFILEDVEPSYAVDTNRDQVDLYGTLSMTIAALQEQAAQIEALRAQVDVLQEQLSALAADR